PMGPLSPAPVDEASDRFGFARTRPFAPFRRIARRARRTIRRIRRFLRPGTPHRPPPTPPVAPKPEPTAVPLAPPEPPLLPVTEIEVEAEASRVPTLIILLPSLELSHLTGGPNTALHLGARVAARGVPVRFVATHGGVETPDEA